MGGNPMVCDLKDRLAESAESEDFPPRVDTGWPYCYQELFWPIMPLYNTSMSLW
jgi:hypothetical protein